jgi:tRNA(Ile)-lysidine synthase
VTPPEALAGPARAVLDAAPPGVLGVAVSGGGDSVALLLLARDWAKASGRAVAAVTVDHGLREGSVCEAAEVAALCARIGVPHDVLRWRGWDGRGNLQDRARGARRLLIADWAIGREIGAVALGHTLDDQAETVIMRLARGSGVDGLAAMAAESRAEGLSWLRPMLGLRRADLRVWLAADGVGWSEDPSNEDAAFARVRARRALGILGDVGLGAERLAGTASRMARARAALEDATRDLARRCLVEGEAGDVALDPVPLRAAPEEIRLRLLASVLMRVSGAVYRPRLARLEALLAALEAGRIGHGATLHGCVLRRSGAGVAVRREPAAMAGRVPAGRRWDGRWELIGEAPPGMEIGGLGAAGLARRADWRGAGIARETLLTTPALWRGETLVDAPFARGAGPAVFRRAGDPLARRAPGE